MAATTTTAASPAALKITSAAELAAAFPDQAAALRAEGADAERQRILGIEQAALSGHDTLVAEMKADGETSPEQAAMRILNAEKIARASQMQGIRDVESHTSMVSAAPAAHATLESAGSTPEAWKAEYAKDAALQAEFGSVEAYVSYQEAVSSGKVRLLTRKQA